MQVVLETEDAELQPISDRMYVGLGTLIVEDHEPIIASIILIRLLSLTSNRRDILVRLIQRFIGSIKLISVVG